MRRRYRPSAGKNGITIIAYRPLGKGALLKNSYKSVLEELGRRYGRTPAQILINWVIRHDNVIAMAKTMRMDHLNELLSRAGG